MKITIDDDATAVLIARRAALAAQDAQERETRLVAARQQEEARFVEAGRIATTFGRFLRRTTMRPQPAPTPLLQRRGDREQAAAQPRQDAA